MQSILHLTDIAELAGESLLVSALTEGENDDNNTITLSSSSDTNNSHVIHTYIDGQIKVIFWVSFIIIFQLIK